MKNKKKNINGVYSEEAFKLLLANKSDLFPGISSYLLDRNYAL